VTLSPLRVALIGTGRMGRAVRDQCAVRGVEVVAELDRTAMRDSAVSAGSALDAANVAIEFTTPNAAPQSIHTCLEHGCPVVVGTTGWYDSLPSIVKAVEAAEGTLLWAPNFSLGAAILSQLVRRAGTLASTTDFDAHIVDTHHSKKLDAPSGTALRLAEAASATLGREIPITSIRTGSVPGTHTLTLEGQFERISLTHEARDRRVFAEGAVVAAEWLRGRTGVFTMDDLFDPDAP
jgi:4-hydroxy-tetrahydrodipicolinate reductase